MRAFTRISFGLAIVATVWMGVASARVASAQEEAAPAEAGSPTDDAYVGKLVDALRGDESFKVRLQAAVFLGRTNDPRAIDPLLDALANDQHYTVRGAAASALAQLNEPRAISHIIRALAVDPDAFVRTEADRALEKYDREDALPYVVATYGSDDATVRKTVVEYLTKGSTEGAEPVLARALGDNAEIFAIARSTVAAMPEDRKLEFLGQATEHREPEVRRGAVQVLHSLGTKKATQAILEVYDRDIEVDEVRNATQIALRDLRKFLEVDQIVKDASVHADKHARAKALKLLGVVGGAEAQKALLTALRDDDIYLRGTAVMAMRELGDPSVVPSLEKLTNDPANQRIAHLVRHTLKQLRKQQGSN